MVLELNAGNVRKGKDFGMPVYYGDATSEEALPHAHVDSARRVVERDGLLKLGARDVVAEEVEGAVEIIPRMLRGIEVPRKVGGSLRAADRMRPGSRAQRRGRSIAGMFVIGVVLSLRELLQAGKIALIGGLAQVLIMIGLG